MLAEFDRREGWRADGQLSGAEWLAWRCGMSARTAREKPRVAHELRRRPAAAAFSLSYCKVRAVTRITGVDEGCDRWLVALAENGTVADLDRAVRHWEHLRDQDQGVEDYLRRRDRRALRASRTYDGTVVAEVVLPVEEGEEVLRLLDAVGWTRLCTLVHVNRRPQAGGGRTRWRSCCARAAGEGSVGPVPTAAPCTWWPTSTRWPTASGQ